jgi:hypothetical protein
VGTGWPLLRMALDIGMCCFLAARTSAPEYDLSLVNYEAGYVRRFKTRSNQGSAVDVHRHTALTADDVMVVVGDARLEASRTARRFDPADQADPDQRGERVIRGLRGDRADPLTDGERNLLHGKMIPGLDRCEYG